MQVEDLEIDEYVLEKIETKHGAQFAEVEEACFSPRRHIRRGRMGVYKLFRRTDAGRLLVVIFVDRGERVWRVVTARDMDDAERRYYVRQVGG
jgi:uncharacterized DUF497 family protein